MKIYNHMIKYIKTNFKYHEILESDIPEFEKTFNASDNLNLFKEIIHNDNLLEKISSRSYTHALGFDKIVLFDMAKDSEIDNKVQLRLHL